MNKQRKLVFAVCFTVITIITMLLISNNPATANSESVVIENEDNGFALDRYTKQLKSDYEDLLIEEQIQEEEDRHKFLINNYENNDVKVQCVKEEKKKKKNTYSKKDLMLLAGAIENEANSSDCSDDHQMAVVSVILNRVKSDYYPDTIEGVLFQRNQYDIQPRFYNPSKRAIRNARRVLKNGKTLPDCCLFQSEFKQGDFVYKVFRTSVSTTYICGKN